MTDITLLHDIQIRITKDGKHIGLVMRSDDGERQHFGLAAAKLPELITPLLAALVDPQVRQQLPKQPTPKMGEAQTTLALPIQGAGASYAPLEGKVAITFSVLGGYNLSFQLLPSEATQLAQGITNAARKAVQPKPNRPH